jgi:integrase
VASIILQASGRRMIQYMASDGRRKSIRLGKVSQRDADEIRRRVELLNGAQISRCPIDNETARWVSDLGDGLATKLAALGLIQHRGTSRLKEFIDGYIAQRTDVRPNTVKNLKAAQVRLVEFFGPDKQLRDVTPGDADSWVLWLKERYADATVGRTLKRARQFFRVAQRRRLVLENPFDGVKGLSEANESRKYFLSRSDAQKVLDACPNAEWRLIFALSRYGGLRCPSETLTLELSDVDWERDRILIRSPKTGDRWIPIFPELRPYLLEVCELAAPGTRYVITRYRDSNANLRTHLLRIIRRAGLSPWPKLFHNLRATCETELAAQYPVHVVCSWIGHAARIAAKHYLQVTDADFARGASVASNSQEGDAESDALVLQKALQHIAALCGKDRQGLSELLERCGFVPNSAT